MIFTLIVLLIDLILKSYFNFTFNNLTYFTPLLLVATLNISYLLIKDNKRFLILLVLLGLLYDLFYSTYYFVNLIIFILLGLFIILYNKKKNINILDIFLTSLLSIIVYDAYLYLISFLLGYSYSLDSLIYKISHTLLLNLLFVGLIYLVLKCHIFKKKKMFN